MDFLFASMDHEAGERATYKRYLDEFRANPKGRKKPMDRDTWEAKYGKGVGKKPAVAPPQGAKKPKAEKPPAKSYKKTYHKNVTSVMDAHSLTDGDADEVKSFKNKKPSTGKPVPPAELLRRFLEHAKPETKARMKGVSPADFVKMLGAIMDDGDGAEGGGKKASYDLGSGTLRERTIRLAHAVPELRAHLVPLLRKEAGGGVG